MIVSDHGMTESGNHGGSSFEETDSLAVFVGAKKFGAASEIDSRAYQVDIAVTLALLFGVPIPRNNVGTVMSEVFTSLKDEHQLRMLQLNSWQLMRLLQTHLSGLGCGEQSCLFSGERDDGPERFCCSYISATTRHESLKSKNFSRSSGGSSGGDDYRSIASAYDHFLRTASVWLSSRATDKPLGHLAFGVGAMLVSCLGLVILFLYFDRDVRLKERNYISRDDNKHKKHLDEIFAPAIILILVLSMGSSSMVEEEQYIWHFMTSSLYLILLRKAAQSFTSGVRQPSVPSPRTRNYSRIYYIVAVLVSGRILRAWHQGGVNWSYLPDIAKFLEQAGPAHLKTLQLISVIIAVFMCLAVLFTLQLRIRIMIILILIYLFPVLLILKQVYDTTSYASSSLGSTTSIQIIYALVGSSTMGILLVVPWLMPLEEALDISGDASSIKSDKKFTRGLRESVCVIGWCYIFSWCLLQLLLQQPVNTMPLVLLLVQILASVRCFSDRTLHLKQWVKVASLYYIGMEGHFGLGNTNTLATIDVAGAYMGISSHSTIISGILMFMITYASPILALLSMLMLMDVDMRTSADPPKVDFRHLLKTTVGYLCLVSLGLNSIVLLAYTIVLLLMQHHLFIWSVFSPKYLYVCATTACVYIGVSILCLTAAYTSTVFSLRMRLKGSC